MWIGKCEERLGEYYKSKVFNSTSEQVAYIKDDTVFPMKNKVLGQVKSANYELDSGSALEENALVIHGEEAAKCFPKSSKVALAGIVLLRDKLEI